MKKKFTALAYLLVSPLSLSALEQQDTASISHTTIQSSTTCVNIWGQEELVSEENAVMFNDLTVAYHNYQKTYPQYGKSDLIRWLLGHMYYKGLQNKPNYEKAFRIWKSTPTHIFPKIHFNLGFMYEQGQGVPQDDKKAIKYYQQDYPNSKCNLGVMYAEGRGGLDKDEEMAIKLFQRAADLGSTQAQKNLEILSRKEEGSQEAVQFYREGLTQPSGDDWYSPSINLFDNLLDTKIRFLQHAADLGSVRGICDLGSIYLYGRGTTQNYQKALHYFQQALQHNHSDVYKAQSALGYMYETGLGVPKDEEKAFDYYTQAMSENDFAKLHVALCKKHGKGTSIDLVQAEELYKSVDRYIKSQWHKQHGLSEELF